jgi:HAMP domain-containing protein
MKNKVIKLDRIPAAGEFHVTPVLRDKLTHKYTTYVAGIIPDTTGNPRVVLIQLNLAKPYKILKNYYGLGKTGEVILVQKDLNTKTTTIVSPPRADTTSALITLSDLNDPFASKIQDVFQGKPLSIEGPDYTGKKVLHVSRKVKAANMAIVAKMDADEVYGATDEISQIFFYGAACIVLFAVLLAMMFARSLTRPLFAMRNTLGLVAQGMLPEATEERGSDEFGQMGRKVDELVQTLRSNADFAKKIGEGKYDTEFKPASDDDILGMSLITMRKNLIENERRDTERNWIVRGVAEISEILRMHDSIDELGDDVVKFILGKIGAVQGAFYVVNDEAKPALIELRASFAYNRKK